MAIDKIELPAETLDSLRRSSNEVKVAREFISRMKIAGIDTKPQEEKLTELDRGIRGLRDGFFPGEQL